MLIYNIYNILLYLIMVGGNLGRDFSSVLAFEMLSA